MHLQQIHSWGCCGQLLFLSHSCHCVTLHCAVWGAKAADMQQEQDTERNMGVRPQSTVWKYFTRADKTVSCSICKATLKNHNSSSAMNNHLKLHPLMASDGSGYVSEEKRQQCDQSRQTTIGVFSKRPINDHRKRKITGLLVNFIVKDIRPPAAVSGDGFRDIMHFFELVWSPGYGVIYLSEWSFHLKSLNIKKKIYLIAMSPLFKQRFPFKSLCVCAWCNNISVMFHLTLLSYR